MNSHSQSVNINQQIPEKVNELREKLRAYSTNKKDIKALLDSFASPDQLYTALKIGDEDSNTTLLHLILRYGDSALFKQVFSKISFSEAILDLFKLNDGHGESPIINLLYRQDAATALKDFLSIFTTAEQRGAIFLTVDEYGQTLSHLIGYMQDTQHKGALTKVVNTAMSGWRELFEKIKGQVNNFNETISNEYLFGADVVAQMDKVSQEGVMNWLYGMRKYAWSYVPSFSFPSFPGLVSKTSNNITERVILNDSSNPEQCPVTEWKVIYNTSYTQCPIDGNIPLEDVSVEQNENTWLYNFISSHFSMSIGGNISSNESGIILNKSLLDFRSPLASSEPIIANTSDSNLNAISSEAYLAAMPHPVRIESARNEIVNASIGAFGALSAKNTFEGFRAAEAARQAAEEAAARQAAEEAARLAEEIDAEPQLRKIINTDSLVGYQEILTRITSDISTEIVAIKAILPILKQKTHQVAAEIYLKSPFDSIRATNIKIRKEDLRTQYEGIVRLKKGLQLIRKCKDSTADQKASAIKQLELVIKAQLRMLNARTTFKITGQKQLIAKAQKELEQIKELLPSVAALPASPDASPTSCSSSAQSPRLQKIVGSTLPVKLPRDLDVPADIQPDAIPPVDEQSEPSRSQFIQAINEIENKFLELIGAQSMLLDEKLSGKEYIELSAAIAEKEEAIKPLIEKCNHLLKGRVSRLIEQYEKVHPKLEAFKRDLELAVVSTDRNGVDEILLGSSLVPISSDGSGAPPSTTSSSSSSSSPPTAPVVRAITNAGLPGQAGIVPSDPAFPDMEIVDITAHPLLPRGHLQQIIDARQAAAATGSVPAITAPPKATTSKMQDAITPEGVIDAMHAGTTALHYDEVIFKELGYTPSQEYYDYMRPSIALALGVGEWVHSGEGSYMYGAILESRLGDRAINHVIADTDYRQETQLEADIFTRAIIPGAQMWRKGISGKFIAITTTAGLATNYLAQKMQSQLGFGLTKISNIALHASAFYNGGLVVKGFEALNAKQIIFGGDGLYANLVNFGSHFGVTNSYEGQNAIRDFYNQKVTEAFELFFSDIALSFHCNSEDIPGIFTYLASKTREKIVEKVRSNYNTALERGGLHADDLYQGDKTAGKTAEEAFYSSFCTGGERMGLSNNGFKEQRKAWETIKKILGEKEAKGWGLYPEAMTLEQAKAFNDIINGESNGLSEQQVFDKALEKSEISGLDRDGTVCTNVNSNKFSSKLFSSADRAEGQTEFCKEINLHTCTLEAFVLRIQGLVPSAEAVRQAELIVDSIVEEIIGDFVPVGFESL